VHLLAEDAGWLSSTAEVERARAMVAGGTSADRQRAVLEAAEAGGASREAAMRAVVRHLIEEFHEGL